MPRPPHPHLPLLQAQESWPVVIDGSSTTSAGTAPRSPSRSTTGSSRNGWPGAAPPPPTPDAGRRSPDRQRADPGLLDPATPSGHYRRADGTPTGELDNYRDSLRPLRRLYGRTPAADFGPLALKAVRQAMIDAGLARTTINQRVGRIVRLFKWAVENELVPAGRPPGAEGRPGPPEGPLRGPGDRAGQAGAGYVMWRRSGPTSPARSGRWSSSSG